MSDNRSEHGWYYNMGDNTGACNVAVQSEPGHWQQGEVMNVVLISALGKELSQ